MSDFVNVIEELEMLLDENLPKNVKESINKTIKLLKDDAIEEETKISKALILLDEISDDRNVPFESRPNFWNISCILESMKST